MSWVMTYCALAGKKGLLGVGTLGWLGLLVPFLGLLVLFVAGLLVMPQ